MACLSVIVVRLVLNDVNVVKRRLGNSAASDNDDNNLEAFYFTPLIYEQDCLSHL